MEVSKVVCLMRICKEVFFVLQNKPVGGWCKQTPQVILLKVVQGPQFNKLYFDVYRYRLRIFAICQNDACVCPARFFFFFFYVVGGSELNLK